MSFKAVAEIGPDGNRDDPMFAAADMHPAVSVVWF